jgi:hypothetical protein
MFTEKPYSAIYTTRRLVGHTRMRCALSYQTVAFA